MKTRRNAYDKLKTLLFGKDLRVTEGEPYTEVRDGDFSSYLPIESYIDFSQGIPEEAVDIRDFGADASADSEANAKAIQKTIDECSKKGSVLLVSGGIYETTTLFLKSDITLFIEKGSALSANTSGKGYKHNTLLYAENAENITITGGGRIIGNGHLFGRKPVRENNFAPAKVIDVIAMRQEYRAQLRFAHESKYGSLLITDKCRNIRLENIIFENSAWWTCKILRSEGFKAINCVINNNRNVANADGFDITGSSFVEIDHCFVSTADDGIVLKNAVWCGCDGPMHDISVRNCEVISRTNAFKIGTETTYDIYNVKVEDCSFLMTDLYPGSVSGISLEACDGAGVHDISIKNITMDRCTCPLFIRLNNRNRAAEVTSHTANKTEIKKCGIETKPVSKKTFDKKSELYNIRIKNITAKDIELPVIISGYRRNITTKYCTDILLENFDLTYRDAIEIRDRRLFIPEYVRVYPECWRFRNLPAYGIWARHCKNLKIRSFRCKGIKNSHRKEKIFKDCI